MSEASLPTEFERALVRPDIALLRQVIDEQFAWHEAKFTDRGDKNFELDPIIFDEDDQERNLALVAIAMAAYDDEDYLGLVSAGLLEDIFFNEKIVTADLVERIEIEASRNPRFRWMLSGVWTDSFLPESRELVERLTEGVDFEAGLSAVEGK